MFNQPCPENGDANPLAFELRYSIFLADDFCTQAECDADSVQARFVSKFRETLAFCSMVLPEMLSPELSVQELRKLVFASPSRRAFDSRNPKSLIPFRMADDLIFRLGLCGVNIKTSVRNLANELEIAFFREGTGTMRISTIAGQLARDLSYEHVRSCDHKNRISEWISRILHPVTSERQRFLRERYLCFASDATFLASLGGNLTGKQACISLICRWTTAFTAQIPVEKCLATDRFVIFEQFNEGLGHVAEQFADLYILRYGEYPVLSDSLEQIVTPRPQQKLGDYAMRIARRF